MQALDIASRPKISGLGLSPVCDATLKLIRDASALWSPATHYAYPDAHRAAVFTVLLVANRQLVEGCKGYLTTAMVGGEVIDVPLALPLELWIDEILTYLGCDGFRVAGSFPLLCEYCLAPKERACPACRAAYFCGEEHRLAGWRDHQKRCTYKYRKRKKKKKPEKKKAEGGGGGTKAAGAAD